MTDILDSMAFCGERDQALREVLGLAQTLGRNQVWRLRKGQYPAPSDRVLRMTQCRLGWALRNCDEPDLRTDGLLKEAFKRLKEG